MASLKIYLIVAINIMIASLLVFNLCTLVFDDAEQENASFERIYEDVVKIFGNDEEDELE